ncbi:MAG TPA: amino acid adenylation domain-containing protein [Herpetosiphonaceae bacterium]
MSSVTDGFRLSPQQKRLWLLQQGNASSQTVGVVSIAGKLDVAALKAAAETTVARHSILRTTFHRVPGIKVPIQVIGEESAVAWNEIDLSGMSAEQQAQQIESLAQAQRQHSVEQAPVLHLSLITQSEDRHTLVIELPTLCTDAASLDNLIRAIAQAYGAEIGVEELADEEVQYIQFSEWQNELIEQEDDDAEEGRAFWQNVPLSNVRLPFEYTRPASTQFSPAQVALAVEPQVLAQLEAVSEDLAAVLLTAWQVFCWQLNRQQATPLAYAYSALELEDLEGAIGLFAKWLPIAGSLDAHDRFSDLVARVEETVSEAVSWQEQFIWNADAGSDAVPALGFEFVQRQPAYPVGPVVFSATRQSSNFDLFKIKLSCERTESTLALAIDYNSNLFPRRAIEVLAEQFQTLLANLAAHSDTTIGAVSWISAAEHDRLLAAFSTTAAYPAVTAIHHLIEAQAAQKPEQVAVSFEDQQLTYAELNSYANRLAHYLQKQGAGPETIVGICLDRSAAMIVGLLGVLKAGSAYVPLDPALPAQRLAIILEDTRAPIVISQQHLRERLPEQGVQVINLDSDHELLAQESTANPAAAVVAEDLAYVLFTSGSTGRPKGVAVEHRQLINYVQSSIDELELAAGGAFALISTLAADLGNTMLFPALCTGGTLHVISQELAVNPDALAAYFAQHAIDHLKIAPSHFSALLSAVQPESVVPRQRLIVGGEATSWELVEAVQRLRPECRIFNHYGPTETTVGVIIHPVAGEPQERLTSALPLSRPLANTRIYLLDRQLQIVPTGAPGEIYIGGAGVARGYLNRPDLTAERFLPDPFGSNPGARMYRTGDLARYLPDGSIEFMGRADFQVKIRGFRIELGEIEPVLRRHPAVRECAVVAHEETSADGASELRLVAYVVPQEQMAVNVLRSHLQAQLPEYMIPSAFVSLPALPLLANGKIDRQGLSALAVSRPSLEDTYVAPRTPIEEQVAQIWSDLLRVERVGIHDNFFELGGHSLLATQVMARLRQNFQLDFPVRSLFEAPTVAGLAETIVQYQISLADDDALAALLAEVEQVSADEARNVLDQPTTPNRGMQNE